MKTIFLNPTKEQIGAAGDLLTVKKSEASSDLLVLLLQKIEPNDERAKEHLQAIQPELN